EPGRMSRPDSYGSVDRRLCWDSFGGRRTRLESADRPHEVRLQALPRIERWRPPPLRVLVDVQPEAVTDVVVDVHVVLDARLAQRLHAALHLRDRDGRVLRRERAVDLVVDRVRRGEAAGVGDEPAVEHGGALVVLAADRIAERDAAA